VQPTPLRRLHRIGVHSLPTRAVVASQAQNQ